MNSINDTPDAALESLADASVDRWSIIASSVPGALVAHLVVHLADTVERFSFSVTGWTHEDVRYRIEGLRQAAASALRRRRGEPLA